MKERRVDRFVVLPFNIGCTSQSSVDIIRNRAKNVQAEANTIHSNVNGERNGAGKAKSIISLSVLRLEKPNISAGFHKLVKGFKSLSQLFVILYDDGEEEEDEEREMQIGFPTDVKHVAHIGWDGGNFNSMNKSPDQLLSLPSFSLKQFELAMAAQAGVQAPLAHGPLRASSQL